MNNDYVINVGYDPENLDPVASGLNTVDCLRQIIDKYVSMPYIEIVYSPVDDEDINDIIYQNQKLRDYLINGNKERYIFEFHKISHGTAVIEARNECEAQKILLEDEEVGNLSYFSNDFYIDSTKLMRNEYL